MIPTEALAQSERDLAAAHRQTVEVRRVVSSFREAMERLASTQNGPALRNHS